jgi:hypothetical protein
MVDVTRMPDNSFGAVPTPALVAPIEFTMRLDDYRAMGGHIDAVISLKDLLSQARIKVVQSDPRNPWPMRRANYDWGDGK